MIYRNQNRINSKSVQLEAKTKKKFEDIETFKNK